MQAAIASSEQFEQIMAFYNFMIEATEESPSTPRWERDVHPTRAEIEASIDAGQIIVVPDASLEHGVAAVMRLACEDLPLPAGTVRWRVHVAPGETFTVSLLAVHPEAQGRGLAKGLIAHAVSHARSRGARALRLDCLGTNYQAAGLYESLGFSLCGKGAFHTATLGDTLFYAYELAL